MRIVILDGHPGLAEIMALSLRVAGHSATGFEEVAEALTALRKNDVFVVDYQLPGITGLEVAERAYGGGWRGLLLLMSGHPAVTANVIRHSLLHVVVAKPLSARELLEVLPKLA